MREEWGVSMPIYEFECQKCGHAFEVNQSFRDEQPKTCPQDKCSGKLKKLFSPPAIIFKGSGFYVNDHGRGNGSGSGNGDGSGKVSESDSGSGSDKKPASTPSEGAGDAAKSEACKGCEKANCPSKS
jgi:putative FmdB family regulatory protein